MGLLKQQAINDKKDNWEWKLGGAWVEFSVNEVRKDIATDILSAYQSRPAFQMKLFSHSEG
ncbi:hypothetical protein HanIR_Chr11g0508421 [Helianthus annuus]|nr:hypothetical protein HanIR_Chr11g0508421 [Helianthus annuus]